MYILNSYFIEYCIEFKAIEQVSIVTEEKNC